MLSRRDATEVLDRDFLEARSKILELAATLDRIDRAPARQGEPPDPRLGRLRQALEALVEPGPGRAETIQRIFSLEYDPAWRRHLDVPPLRPAIDESTTHDASAGERNGDDANGVGVSEVATKIIRLARARRQYWDRELPRRHRDYPTVHADEDPGPPPPAEVQLNSLLLGLPSELIYQLVTLMYIGRDESGIPDFAGRLEEMKKEFSKPEWAVSQMIGKALLDEYLAAGLERLGDHPVVGDPSMLSARA